MNIKEFLATTPESLAQKQHDALKAYVVEELKKFTQLISNEKYNEAKSCLNFSPAGDGYGSENYYLSFDEVGCDDLSNVLSRLKQLKELCKVKENKR